MVSRFSEQRRRILELILRLSLGCGKNAAYIPKQRDFEVVGIGENRIKAHIDWLVNAGVIIREGCYYSLNTDFDQWRVCRVAKYSTEKLAELISLNLRTSDAELVRKGRRNFPKEEEKASLKGKFGEPRLASAKERLNKYINTNESGEIWTKVLDRLRLQINTANYQTWLNDTRGLFCRDQVFMLGVPNNSVAEYLDTNLRSLIEKTIIGVTQARYRVGFRVEGGGGVISSK